MRGFINYTNLIRALVNALRKLCVNTLIHNTRTKYMLLDLAAKLNTKVR